MGGMKSFPASPHPLAFSSRPQNSPRGFRLRPPDMAEWMAEQRRRQQWAAFGNGVGKVLRAVAMFFCSGRGQDKK